MFVFVSKYARVDVLTQEEHDREISHPSSVPDPPRPSYLSPSGRETNNKVEDHDKDDIDSILSRQPNNSFDEESNLVESDLAPLPASRWYSRISKHKKVQFNLKKKLNEYEAQRLNRQSQFAVGVGVYTYDPRIAPLLY